MAPMARNEGYLKSQNFREGSWDFTGSEQHSECSRDGSEEPVSYDGDDIDYENEESAPASPALLQRPESNEDVLHPLREAANRVGREVERFAEVLDGYNPLKALNDEEKHEMTFDLIELYHNVALETVERLRDKHASECRRQDGAKWRKKMRGFKISRDPEVMDMDDTDIEFGTSILESNNTTVGDLERWEEEARTWDLLKRMVKVQYSLRGAENHSSQHLDSVHRYAPEHHIWEEFLKSDFLALERQTILRWLQDTAEESGEDIDVLVQELQQNADRGDIIAHGWLHTKAAIKNQKRTHVWPYVLDQSSSDVQKVHLNASRTEPLVTQLDPDAPTRQSRKLEKQDQYFERAIWLGCYELLRRGKSANEIKEWCGDRTEIWRAVSICGLPNYDSTEDYAGLDNTPSTLWRRMCFALARRGGNDDYERAVYGILSGDLLTVEPICQSWDDHLFVHYNALVKCQFDTYIQKHYPSRAPRDVVQTYGIFDAVHFHGEPETSGKQIVDSLNKKIAWENEITRPLKMLQGVLIGKQFEKFIYQQGLALSKFANAETDSILIPKFEIDPENNDLNAYIALKDYDSLRVLVHMLLAFRSLGINIGDKIQELAIENVIVAYIGFLRLAAKEELIPLYASQLTGDRIYATLSRELVDVIDRDQRITLIKLMKELGLDAQKFVRFQTQFLFMDFPDDLVGYPAEEKLKLLVDEREPNDMGRRVRSGFIGGEEDIDRVDLLLIRSLEWYLLVDGLWSETLATGVLLYKRFFKHAKLAAARELSQAVPGSEISLSKTRALVGESLDFHSLEAEGYEEDVTERLDDPSWSNRLLKRHLVAEAKSFRDLEVLIGALDCLELATESIHALQCEMNEKALKENRMSLHRAMQPTRATVRALLHDWLVTSQKEEPEFKLLREVYLPEIILAYDSTLHFAGLVLSRDNFLECMDLSTIIAAEDSDLADLFLRKDRMKELVAAFAENSRALLFANIPGKSRTGSNSKKLRTLGWARDIWSVKP